MPIILLLFLLFCRAALFAANPLSLNWHELPPLPDDHGFAGPFGGVSNDALIVAGGANFPDGPNWAGHPKVWHDRIFVLTQPDGAWIESGRLPRPVAYGVSITWKDQIICIGGSDDERHIASVFSCQWIDQQIEINDWPSLPKPVANAAGVLLNDVIYVAGGSETPDSNTALHEFWKLDLSENASERRWELLTSWPGSERILPVMAAQYDKVLLVGGARLFAGSEGEVTREFLNDGYIYDPVNGTWKEISRLPRSIVAAPNPGIPLGFADVLFFSGDDGENFFRQAELRDNHPGFLETLYRYNMITDAWTPAGAFPKVRPSELGEHRNAGTWPPVTAPVLKWRGDYVIPSGEVRPGVRTPKVISLDPKVAPAKFGLGNWLVLAGYLSALVWIGLHFSKRGKNTEDFFVGGRRLPWWATGLSIFGTMLSAITFLALPARSFATNWTYFLLNMGIIAIAPVIIVFYLPIFRRSKITTAYEYLEERFDRSIRLFGSASFILFQLGRMGVVLLLPALALSAVTGINVYLCIAFMGVLSTLYTVAGGIEAVIWTDVVQVVVLLGGALTALGIIVFQLDGGIGQLFSAGGSVEKFRFANLNFSIVSDSIVVILLGALFSNSLVPYSSDQTLVQRYLTTSDEKQSARAIWTNAIMVLPATIIFLLLGTALFVFYRQYPQELAPLAKADQILPWFIANQMPVGLAGLVIAGVLAAAMSSLDSSMHSLATTVVTDWVKPRLKAFKESQFLRLAKYITLAAGLLGTTTALLLATVEIKFLWDFFLGLMGLLGGTLAGVFAVGVFLREVESRHVWSGILASVATLVFLKFFTAAHSLLFGFVGVSVCFLVAFAARFVFDAKSPAHIKTSH